jgi:hypothetical protein
MIKNQLSFLSLNETPFILKVLLTYALRKHVSIKEGGGLQLRHLSTLTDSMVIVQNLQTGSNGSTRGCTHEDMI